MVADAKYKKVPNLASGDKKMCQSCNSFWNKKELTTFLSCQLFGQKRMCVVIETTQSTAAFYGA